MNSLTFNLNNSSSSPSPSCVLALREKGRSIPRGEVELDEGGETMGQVGLHAITGLAVGNYLLTPLVPHSTGRRALMYGFVLGNILPDLDFLAVVGMYPVNQTLALHLHRGFSHSLLAAVALAAGFYVGATLLQDIYLKFLGYGLSLGCVAHFVEDIFLWFTPVDIFWPASIYGLIPAVDLWWWYDTPTLAGRLMGAAEFAAFALYYEYLSRLALDQQTNLEHVPMLRRMVVVCWVIWAILSALAIDIPHTRFDIFLYVPMGIVFMPACLYLTWRMQNTIETFGLHEPPGPK